MEHIHNDVMSGQASDPMEMVKSYKEFCALRDVAKKTNVMDLSKHSWFYPSLLLPISSFIQNTPNVQVVKPNDQTVASYVDTVTKKSVDLSLPSSYLPVIAIPSNSKQLEEVLLKLYKIHNNGESYGGPNAFKLIFDELIANMYDHAQFTTAFAMAQNYSKKRFLELCFFDNGISIPGSFTKHGIQFKDDYDAIAKAINGVSTKDNSQRERGYGLGDSLALLSKALGGSAIIVSGAGAVLVKGDGFEPFILSSDQVLHGTLIAARIPSEAKEVNIYDFIG